MYYGIAWHTVSGSPMLTDSVFPLTSLRGWIPCQLAAYLILELHLLSTTKFGNQRMEEHPWRNPEIFFFLSWVFEVWLILDMDFWWVYIIFTQRWISNHYGKNLLLQKAVWLLITLTSESCIITTSKCWDLVLWHTCTHPSKLSSYYIYTVFYIACFYLKCSCNQIQIFHHSTSSKLS